MVLKRFLILILFCSVSVVQAKSVAKLKIYRSKIVKAIKSTPYFNQKISYQKYKRYTLSMMKRRKLSKSMLAGFSNLAKIDALLYAKTKRGFYYEQSLKSLYLLNAFGYKKSNTRSILSKLKEIKSLHAKKGNKKVKKKKKKTRKRRKRRKKRRRKVKIHKKWSIYSTLVSWQEDRVGTSNTNQDFLYIAQLRGACTGMSYDFVWKDLHFRTSGCLIFPGSVDITPENTAAGYSETEVSSPGFIVGSGLIYQVYPKQLNFGFNLDLLGRFSKFESSTLEIDGENFLTLGAAGSVEMIRDEKYGLDFKVGYGLAFTSVYWQVGLRYYY